MKTTLEIKDKNLDMVSNALTPILYRQIFKKDFLQQLTSLRKLKGKKREDYTDEDYGLATSRAEMLTQLAFVMNQQAKIVQAEKLVQLTITQFYTWLMDFETDDFNDPTVMSGILAIWQGNSDDSHVESKNADSRE